jgi:hypothetical protein
MEERAREPHEELADELDDEAAQMEDRLEHLDELTDEARKAQEADPASED